MGNSPKVTNSMERVHTQKQTPLSHAIPTIKKTETARNGTVNLLAVFPYAV